MLYIHFLVYLLLTPYIHLSVYFFILFLVLMSDLSHEQLRVPIFNGHRASFQLWKAKLLMTLDCRGLDQFVLEDIAHDTGNSIIDRLQDSQDEKLAKRAKSIICLCLSDDILSSVIDLPTARAVFLELCAQYERNGRGSRIQAWRQFWSLKKGSETISCYIAKVMNASKDLKACGRELSSQDIIDKILEGLPPDFDSIIATLDATEDASSQQTMTIAKVTELLQTRESQISQSQTHFASYTKPRLYKCKVHPLANHSDDRCFTQHPELLSKNKQQQASHYSSRDWHIDSACSAHMTNDRNLIHNFEAIDGKVELADKTTVPIQGRGSTRIELPNFNHIVSNVLYVPDLEKNLYSPGQATSEGLIFLIAGNRLLIYQEEHFDFPKGKALAEISKDADNLYRIPQSLRSICKRTSDIAQASFARRQSKASSQIWHARLGHTNMEDILHLVKNGASGMTLSNGNPQSLCEPCVLGKMTRRPFFSSSTVSKAPGDLIVSDLNGPFRSASYGGFEYFVTYMDHCTRYCYVIPLKRKSDQFQTLKDFISLFSNQFNCKIKQFQSDNGGEYTSKESDRWLISQGIHHRTSVAGDSESNGLAERLNRTLTDIAMSLLAHAQLPIECFSWAVSTAAHIYNRRPHSSLVDKMTPFQALRQSKPDLHYLRIFGCTAYRRIPDHTRRKPSFRSHKTVFIGYANSQKAYILVDPVDNKQYTSRDVEFDEENFFFGFGRDAATPITVESNPFQSTVIIPASRDLQTLRNILVPEYGNHDPLPASANLPAHEEIDTYCFEDPDSMSNCSNPQNNSGSEFNVEDLQLSSQDDESSSAAEAEFSEAVLRQSTRIHRAPGEWWKVHQANCSTIQNIDFKQLSRPDITSIKMSSVEVPTTATAALKGPESGHWYDAMQAEYQQMIDFKTWSLSKLPHGRKAIDCKWVFTVKPSLVDENSIRKFKARLVIKGFSQRPGIDYSETFAPVAHSESFRIVLALAANHGFYLRQVDVVGAFLNGDVSEEIFMKQPEGFAVRKNEDLVCRLNKALYGLKQAGMIWNHQLDSFLTNELQFRKTMADPCIYTLEKGDFKAMILVHVDDMIIAHNNVAQCDAIINSLKGKWDITDLGEPSRVLGMQLVRNGPTGSIFLHQQDYVAELLSRFNMDSCKPVTTPHQPGFYLSADMCPSSDQDRADMRTVPYAELVGSLNWLATHTRLDIANAVGTLCRFISNPGRQHWRAAQRVLKYLGSTSDHGIRFTTSKPNVNDKLLGFCDADWAGNSDNRRSTTGFLFTLHGSPISWKSKLQASTALSSVEAEYISLCAAAREAKWTRQLLFELGFPQDSATTIFEDNKGCIAISGNDRTDTRSKHIDVKYHFVRQMIKSNQIQVEYLPTEEMIADMFTKPTSTMAFQKCRAPIVFPRHTWFEGACWNSNQDPSVEYNLPASSTDIPQEKCVPPVGATTANA